jgi:hypothetical protein
MSKFLPVNRPVDGRMGCSRFLSTQSFVFPAFMSWEIRFRHFSLGFVKKHWILFRKLYYSPKLIKNAETQRALRNCPAAYTGH